MNQNQLVKRHNKFLKSCNNKIIKTYFGEIQVFHDSTVYKFLLDPYKGSLEIRLMQWNGRKKLGYFTILFQNIFRITLQNNAHIGIENYDFVGWEDYFYQRNKNEFLYCYFDLSDFSKISKKYLKKQSYKANLLFDCFFNVELEFTDIIVKGSSRKKTELLGLYKKK